MAEIFNRTGKRLVNLGQPLNFFLQGMPRPGAYEVEGWDGDRQATLYEQGVIASIKMLFSVVLD